MASELTKIGKAVEATMKNARGPVDNYFDIIQAAFGLNPWLGTGLVDRLQHIARQSVHANFEFMGKLTRAKDYTDVMRAQAEYAQSQFGLFSEEIKATRKTTLRLVSDQE
jgi:hypothetical protein